MVSFAICAVVVMLLFIVTFHKYQSEPTGVDQIFVQGPLF